jgi:primosomal protein N'
MSESRQCSRRTRTVNSLWYTNVFHQGQRTSTYLIVVRASYPSLSLNAHAHRDWRTDLRAWLSKDVRQRQHSLTTSLGPWAGCLDTVQAVYLTTDLGRGWSRLADEKSVHCSIRSVDQSLHHTSETTTSSMSSSGSSKRPHFTTDPTTATSRGKTRRVILRVKGHANTSVAQRIETPCETAKPNFPPLVAVPRAAKPPPPPLYDYQVRAIHDVLQALQDGLSRIAVSAATGSGKTAMFVSLVQYIPNRSGQDKVLIVVPSLQIMKQVVCEIRLRLPDYQVAEEQGQSYADLEIADM